MVDCKKRPFCIASDREKNNKSIKQMGNKIFEDADVILDGDDSEDETYIPDNDQYELTTDDDSDWHEDSNSGDQEIRNQNWPNITDHAEILYKSDISDGWQSDSYID